MSQRGPGPYPASRRSSRSPVRHNQGSPRYSLQPSSTDVRYEPAPLSSADFGRPAQQLPPKLLGVHNILNPSEPPYPMGPEMGGRPPSRSRESESTMPPYSAHRPVYPGYASTASLPSTPVAAGVTPLARPPHSERNSPASNYHPFTALNMPRKASSPRQPRSLSLSHPRDLDHPHPQPHLPNTQSNKRPYEPDVADEPRPAPGIHQHSLSLGSHGSVASTPRSISQTLARPSDGPLVPPPSVQPPGEMQNRPSILHGPTQYPPSVPPGGPPSRPLSRVGVSADNPSGWPEVLRRSGVSGSYAGVEPQQAYMTLPGSDTPIPVQVDYSQASKKADEKRQRNAKASTRHRRKKKTLQEENIKQLQDLKEERMQMLRQIDDLAIQRDFYKDERNRLRELVARTPAISKHATGPPSPVSAKSVGSLMDRSPVSHSLHMHNSSQGYASETSSIDRPTQRRRTDERPEFSTPAYGPPGGLPPHALPPVHGQPSYGMPPRPPSANSASSSAGAERLPPLRSMEGMPPHGMVSGHPQEQDLRTGHWRAAQPMQYETGWATAPRKPQDSHQW